MVGCLSDPLDIRFRDGVATWISSEALSSVDIEEQTEDIPVLVAESREPYRQLPLASTFHPPLLDVELPKV